MNSALMFESERRLAREFPRDIEDSLASMLAACSDPVLGEIGVYVFMDEGEVKTGAGIRLAEALAQSWGNFKSGIEVLSATRAASACRAYAYDLQTGTSDEKLFSVSHFIGGATQPITDTRQLYELVQGAGARSKRACILAVLPGFFVRQALMQIDATAIENTVITQTAIDKLFIALARHKVGEAEVAKYIGSEDITPANYLRLKRIANSLDEGMTAPWAWFPDMPRPGREKAPAQTVADLLARETAPAGEPEEREQTDPFKPSPAYTKVRQQIEAATSVKALDTATMFVETFDEAERDWLRAYANAKRSQLNQPSPRSKRK